MSRVGTEFDPPKKGVLGIVDVNVLYHSLSGLTSPSNATQLPISPFSGQRRLAGHPVKKTG
jgi:hypothetical protein